MLIIVEFTREHHCYITSFEMEKQYARKTAINHLYEGKNAENSDSRKVFTSEAQSVTVNNININNSTGTIIGNNNNMMENTFESCEHAAAGENVQPRMLEDELRHQARIYSEEILPPPIKLERAIVPVSLQIAREPVRVPNVLLAEGHLHRRKDIVKFFERPPGDITEEKMFDLPKQQAQKKADRTCKTDDDKMDYIKKHGNILAVIGWPGIGKTTSMRRWIGQIVFGKLIPNVKYVFFIFVRDIDFSKKMTVFEFLLSTIISNWKHSTESDNAWLEELVSDQNVLIALEGIDESAVKDLTIRAPKLNLYDTAYPLHIMLNLIGGKLLPLARIVISSRPDQLFHLHAEHRPKCIVQILGLNKDAQDELGHQIWGARYERVKMILEKNPHTFAYCFVPVNFILTADYLMSESEVDFVCMTRVLASACKKYSVSDHLHGKECDLDKLSKLAWNGYKKMQIVFEEADLTKVNVDENTMRSFLNISVVKSANIKMTIMEGDKRSSFSHLIWQEFFVAVHLLHYSTNDFDQLLQHIHKARWEVVSKFLFGLCNSGVFDNMRCFKGSCSKVQWLDKRDQLKKVAIARMKSLNPRLPAHQDVESPQNQSQSVTASLCETSSEYEPPVMSPCLQSTAYSCQQMTTNQKLQLPSNQYEPVAPNQHQNTIANQMHLFHPLYQYVTNSYEQQAANQHVPVWARSHQQMVPQLNQSLMTSQSHQLSSNQFMSNQSLCYSYPSYQPMWNQYHQSAESQHPSEAYNWQQPMRHQYEQLVTSQYRPTFEISSQRMNQQLHQNVMSNHSHQFPSDQFVSTQLRHHPSHPGPRHIVKHFDRLERTQHLPPEIKRTYQATRPDDQQPKNKYPRLTGSSYQHLRPNHYEQLTANPYSKPLADQQRLSLASQFQLLATNPNRPFPANFHNVSPGTPLSHPASTHYQQVAASSGQEFASNQPYVVNVHHPVASQAPLSATHQFQQSSSTEFQPNSLQPDPLTHHLQQLAAKPLHDDDDHHQQRATGSDEDNSYLSEEDLSDEDNNREWKTVLQVCSWIHEANDENITRDVVAYLPDHIEFPQQSTILPSDVSDLFYALQSSLQSHTLEVNNCSFTGDSLKIFSKEVSSNIKIQRFCPKEKKLNNKDFAAVVEISQHVEEELKLVDCEITSCRVSSLAEKLRETGHKIQHLNLSYNKFSDEGLLNLALCLKNIQKLELWGCGISSAGCAKFAKTLMETGNTIQHLDLSYNKFSDEGFLNLTLCLKNIQKLELSDCDISSAGCAKFAKKLMETGNTIQHLNLSDNKFSDEGLLNLALCLKNIQKLELRSCDISSAGCAKFAKKLMATGNTIQHLNLSYNKFSDEGLSNLALCLKNIQKLELSDCDILSAGCAKFAKKLMETGNTIQHLNLSYNKFSDEGLSNLALCLKNIQTLELIDCDISSAKFAKTLMATGNTIQHLDLGHNKFSDEGLSNLALCLKNIQKLELWDCGISSAGCAKFAETLMATGNTIQHLNLSDNKFSDEGLSNLTLCLKNIQKLELIDCDISSAGCAKFAKKLMATGNTIQHLNLSYNKFSDEGLLNLALCLKNIQKLELWGCNISSAGCAKFAKKLMATGNTIQHLDLGHNKFSDEGLSNLALCLKNIQKLELWDCDISSAGCAKFAKKLMATGNTIQHLNLSGNKFSDEGLLNLALCLKNIQKLELIDCDISSAGCAKFAKKLMATGNTIQHLNLSGNKFSDEGLSNLALCLKNIQKLELSDCDISSAGCAKFAKKSMETGNTLELFDLSGNWLMDDGGRSLIPCLNLFEVLRLYSCNVTEAEQEEIRSELKRLGLPESRVKFSLQRSVLTMN